MRRRPRELKELARLWARWTEYVAEAARNSGRVRPKRNVEYGELHQTILRTIDALSRDCDKERADLIRQIKSECRPWVSLEAFAMAERHILLELHERARQIQRRLPKRRFMRRLLRVASGGLVVLLAAGLTYALRDESTWARIAELRVRFWYMLPQTNILAWLIAIVALVMVFGVWILKRTREY